MSNPIQSNIQLASRLTASLFREHIINADSVQALFDVLCDALASRPDVVASVAADLDQCQEERDDYLANVMTRLDDMEQDFLRRYHATIDNEIAKGHNND